MHCLVYIEQNVIFVGDDISTGDPEDILDRFMAKQDHRR